MLFLVLKLYLCGSVFFSVMFGFSRFKMMKESKEFTFKDLIWECWQVFIWWGPWLICIIKDHIEDKVNGRK